MKKPGHTQSKRGEGGDPGDKEESQGRGRDIGDLLGRKRSLKSKKSRTTRKRGGKGSSRFEKSNQTLSEQGGGW